ncbi:MAG: sugar phosphate isomerase/epimerase family protein [Armatimonadota bacterium]
MQVGLLTAPFRNEPMDAVVRFAAEAGFDALEIDVRPGCKHLCVDHDDAAAADAIVQVREAGLQVSSLAAYVDISSADEQTRDANRATLARAVAMAGANGIGVVCCMAGMPAGGLSREDTIAQIAGPFFREFCPRAADQGVKLAMENWFATNIMNLAHWELIFDTVPASNFGLNYDPSHLMWQGIDYLHAVEVFKDRIFHCHAKDTEVLAHKLRWLGNQAGRGWWRYCIPGYGDIDWGVLIARLRDNGYNGVLSIEHEDRALGREEGLVKGLHYLRIFA